MTSRRRFLTTFGGTGVLISSAGCVGARWWETDDDASSNATSDETDSANNGDNQAPTRDNLEETTDDSDDETGETPDDTHSEDGVDDDDRQHKPDKDDLAVNESEYERQGSSETHERSPDDITVEATAELEKSGGATVTGTVTNVSDESIDVVDLEVIFYDTSESYLTADLISITDLDAGESESFEITITLDQARGEPDHVDIQPTVYDRSD